MNEGATNDPIRIALTGRMRSGKSLIANHLAREYGLRTVSFGDSLKYYADEIFPHFTERITKKDELFGGEILVGVKKPRQLYQRFGQMMREIDEDIWIQHAERTVESLEDSRSVKGVVIDDLRQPNEYIWARDHGFTIIRVNANEDTRLERARALGDSFEIEDLRHETEMYVDDYEVAVDIWNDGEDAEDLKRRVDVVMAELLDGKGAD